MRVMGRETTAQRREIELLDSVYRNAVARFIERLSMVTEDRWARPAARGKRSASETLAHLVRAQSNGLQLISASLEGRAGVSSNGVVGAAESEDSDSNGQPGRDLLRLLGSLTEAQLAILASLPDDGLLAQPATAPEWRRPGTLKHLYDHLYVHFIVHYQEIRAEADNPRLPHWFEDWMPESSNDFYRRALGILPLTYNVEHLPRGEVSICFDLAQPGGGRWSVRADASSASWRGDCEGEPRTTISARPKHFIDYWLGAGGKVRIRGDAGAARALPRLFPLT